jgi:hypothetical protein
MDICLQHGLRATLLAAIFTQRHHDNDENDNDDDDGDDIDKNQINCSKHTNSLTYTHTLFEKDASLLPR